MKMKLYYFESRLGCGIRAFKDGHSASIGILKEVGEGNGLKFVKEATQTEIAWVRGMGGYIPEVKDDN